MRVGFIIKTEEGRVVSKSGMYVGEGTNNVAEYLALIMALREAARLGFDKAICNTDSQLIVRHVSGQYEAKHPKIKVLLKQLRLLSTCFTSVDIRYVGRENNKEADALSHQSLYETEYPQRKGLFRWQAARVRQWKERNPELYPQFIANIFKVIPMNIINTLRGDLYKNATLDGIPDYKGTVNSLDTAGFPDKDDIEEITPEPSNV